MVLAKVYVTLKPGVLDPAGKAIEHSLHALGFDEVTGVRLGKYLEVRLDGHARDAADRRIDDMCRKLLANGVIEDYRFELLD
ncbi:MAG TPA: phosphoribosylformylglycinamidine synthase subunit PurS [Candidatus Kryptonia bacterium]|nr:phosphoribosylformylglycinamidine synthase subunit PurS [Candidatus Kryptonia bacterium]